MDYVAGNIAAGLSQPMLPTRVPPKMRDQQAKIGRVPRARYGGLSCLVLMAT